MDNAERRSLYREKSIPNISPLRCFILGPDGVRSEIKIINYHFKGACFQVEPGDFYAVENNSAIKFSIGNREIKEKITYRVVWESVEENGMFGVEFTGATSNNLERAYRFKSHDINKPTVKATDPLDPNRTIYFQVQNLSKTGFLLTTSLTNKHIFPGMELVDSILIIPGMGEASIHLYIENSHVSDDKSVVNYGVSIQNPGKDYMDLASKYISNLGRQEQEDDRLEKIAETEFLKSKLSKHLTIKVVETQNDYIEVLKLRFLGYKLAGKVKDGETYNAMGEGLRHEGILLAAYLGGQLVASCDFRLSRLHSMHLKEKIDLNLVEGLNQANMAEIHKLVVHPSAKGSDVVLGIFQKIHTIAIINGTPDGVILAEPNLVSLYERLGFQKKENYIPHPNKPNSILQVMLIKGKTYATSEGMNPYAWSLAFELSHRFFADIGVQRQMKFSIWQRTIKYLTSLYLKHFRKKKATASKKSENAGEAVVTRDVSDPRWTKQHVNATVILPYILVAEETIGVEKSQQILFKFGLDKDYFRKVSNWVSIEFFDTFLDEYSKHGDPYRLNKEAGYRATSREILGANYFIMKHFFSPSIAFKTFEKYLPKFNKTRVYKVVDSGSNYCRIKITNLDRRLLPRNHSSRENWLALLDAYVLILTGRPAQIQLIHSSFDGDDFCEYLVRWKNPAVKSRVFWIGLVIISSLGVGYVGFPWLGIRPSAQVLSFFELGLGFFVLLFAWYISNKKYNEILESMHELEDSADLKYRELQSSKQILEKSYQESKLLDSINRRIQTTDDLNETLDIALESACTKFGFKRAFIMILDEERSSLRTASVYGAKETVADLWKFSVDVSLKRDNPVLLSSVFRTGQSVIVNDIESHLFHLNEKSRFLIKHLNVKAFSMVPIPSYKTNWGVLIADKGSSEEAINRRDLVSLKRISQSIGLALDKKSKLDAEITARKIFQKYVPSWLVDETLKNEEPQLGGKSKEAICLFLDISKFYLHIFNVASRGIS